MVAGASPVPDRSSVTDGVRPPPLIVMVPADEPATGVYFTKIVCETLPPTGVSMTGPSPNVPPIVVDMPNAAPVSVTDRGPLSEPPVIVKLLMTGVLEVHTVP